MNETDMVPTLEELIPQYCGKADNKSVFMRKDAVFSENIWQRKQI